MALRRTGRLLVYALLLAFLTGAVLSPPDPFTQILYAGGFLLVAVPAVLLYVHYVDGEERGT